MKAEQNSREATREKIEATPRVAVPLVAAAIERLACAIMAANYYPPGMERTLTHLRAAGVLVTDAIARVEWALECERDLDASEPQDVEF